MRTLSPDLVTLDIEMPEMDGLTTLRAIRKTYPRLPVVMFSALTERGAADTLEALHIGASDYVTKPSSTAGKSVGHDLQEGKLTLPVLLACEADPALGRRIRNQLGEQGVPAAVATEILADVRGAGGDEKSAESLAG